MLASQVIERYQAFCPLLWLWKAMSRAANRYP